MKSILTALVSASFCLCMTSGHAGQDEKEIPIQQETKPVSQDDWQVTFTPYAWVPSVDLNLSVPEIRIGNRTIGGDFSVNQPWWETLSKFSSNYYVLTLDARLEVWKGRWGGFIDGYWIFGKSTVNGGDSRLVIRDRVDITTSSSVTSRFDTGQVNFGPQFKLGHRSAEPDFERRFHPLWRRPGKLGRQRSRRHPHHPSLRQHRRGRRNHSFQLGQEQGFRRADDRP